MNNNEKITPLVLTGHISSRRGYLNSDQLTQFAIDRYRFRNGRGITYLDLMDSGLALHKRQAHDILKYHLKIGTIFTIRNHRPRQYYPSTLKSEIIKNDLAKITPIDHTGVIYCNNPRLPISSCLHPASKYPLSNCMEAVVNQTLEGYVLPLLPSAPLFIHNIHLKLKVIPECYTELNIPSLSGNNGKRYSEVIGTSRVDYTFYPSGTVNVEVRCSNHPLRLKYDDDRCHVLIFFGQLRQVLISYLMDRHERIVPDIMNWEVAECDINKDIKVSDWFQYTGLKVQLRHLDHVFCLYVKSRGKDTVYRVEERKCPHKPPLQFINDVFNPEEKVEQQIAELRDELFAIRYLICKFLIGIHEFN